MLHEHGEGKKCLWECRGEILGLILIIIATIITIVTFNSVGIAAMFLVGLVLCGHRHLYKHCGSHKACCDSLVDDGCESEGSPVKKTTASKKKTTTK